MKQPAIYLLIGLVPSICLAAQPATQQLRGDQQTFAVQAIAPSLPALKYELTVEAIDRQPGDAAGLYMQAMLLLPADAGDLIEHAEDAHDAGKSLADDQAIALLFSKSKSVFDLLALASRREQCDWNVPYREQGMRTMLPQLNHMRTLATLLRVRCDQQIDQGKIDDAVATIQMEYALGRNAAKGMPLVGGLVGIGITAVANSTVEELCTHPTAPNLYWPLRAIPQPFIDLRDVMDGERQYLIAQVPVLAKGKSGHITAEDWPQFVQQYQTVQAMNQPNATKEDAGAGAVALGLMSLPSARKFYAQTRHVAQDEVSKIDSKQVLAIYFIEQFQIAMDEQSKILTLPTDEAIKQSNGLPDRLKELGIDSANIASILMPATTRISRTFGRVDRQLAALMAVQAIRAYAADHHGQFPAKLEDVLETPIRVNPMTGKMFDYRVEGAAATLSDVTSPGSDLNKGFPLIYTLRIEKP
jgi:hypothetical protein